MKHWLHGLIYFLWSSTFVYRQYSWCELFLSLWRSSSFEVFGESLFTSFRACLNLSHVCVMSFASEDLKIPRSWSFEELLWSLWHDGLKDVGLLVSGSNKSWGSYIHRSPNLHKIAVCSGDRIGWHLSLDCMRLVGFAPRSPRLADLCRLNCGERRCFWAFLLFGGGRLAAGSCRGPSFGFGIGGFVMLVFPVWDYNVEARGQLGDGGACLHAQKRGRISHRVLFLAATKFETNAKKTTVQFHQNQSSFSLGRSYHKLLPDWSRRCQVPTKTSELKSSSVSGQSFKRCSAASIYTSPPHSAADTSCARAFSFRDVDCLHNVLHHSR